MIKLFLHEYSNVTLEQAKIKIDNIKDNPPVEQGVPLITIKNKKSYVRLPSLRYTMTAQVEAPDVRILSVEDD